MPQVYGYAVFTGIQSFSYLKTFSICLLLVGAGATTNILGALKGDGLPGLFSLPWPLQPHTRLSSCSLPASALYQRHISILLNIIHLLSKKRGYAPSVSIYEKPRAHRMAAFFGLALILGLLGQTIPVITLMKGIPIVGSSIAGALASIELPVAVISSAIFLGETVTITQSLVWLSYSSGSYYLIFPPKTLS